MKITLKHTLQGIKRLFHFLKGHSLLYILGLVMISSYSLLTSVFEGQLYSAVAAFAGMNGREIAFRLGSVFLLLICLVILAAAGTILYQRAVSRGDEELRRYLGSRLIHMPLSEWHKRHSGDWMTILGKDTDDATETYKEKATNLIACILQAVGGFIILFSVSRPMALWGLCIGFLNMGIGFLTWKRMHNFQLGVRNAGGQSTIQLSNQISGQWINRFYHLQPVLSKKMNESLTDTIQNGMGGARISTLNGALWQMGYTLAYSGALIVGLLLVNRGFLELPQMLAMWPLSLGVAEGLSGIGYLFNDFQETAAAVERINQVLDLPQETLTYSTDPKANHLPQRAEHASDSTAVSIDSVNFSYTGEQNVLQNFSLDIKTGERIAFVGESGSGKTTLIKLLMGFYQPQSGTIDILGIEPKGTQLKTARSLFSYVPQMPHLLNLSIYENIAMIKPDCTEEEVFHATQLAGADEFIRRLPDGYQTMAGENGNHLSGGQKQRIAIARAFLRDAPIIIFDEVTAALDGQSEAHINQALENTGRDKTILLITHRLSTATLADRIIVLKDGQIVETGSHEQLLAKDGYYNELWKAAGTANC